MWGGFKRSGYGPQATNNLNKITHDNRGEKMKLLSSFFQSLLLQSVSVKTEESYYFTLWIDSLIFFFSNAPYHYLVLPPFKIEMRV